uniref:PHD finger protein 14 n=1 Tax=Globodera rostochiensis TaxID=31243 RepID=A0A914HMC9_GLORO
MDKERHNFLSGAVAREPGKRQIKPNAAFFDEQQLLPCGEDDDEEDEDVIFPLSNESRCSDDDESGESANDGDSFSQSADERQSDDSGGNSSDDEDTRDNVDHNHKIAAVIQLDAEGGASTSNNNTNNLITVQQQQQLLKKRKRGGGKNNKKINGLMGHQNDDGTKQETVADPSTEPADGSSEAQLCAICLNLRPADHCGELIQCDRCALSVHELCYGAVVVEDDGGGGSGEHQQAAATPNNSSKHQQQEEFNNQPKNGHLPPIASASATADTQSVVSSASTEPWFCEPCLFNVADVPHCELCPSRYGAFKKAVSDAGGGWVHVLCAAFTPGVSFADAEALSAVSWRGIDTRAFGRKACAGCCSSGGRTPTHALGARTGITVQCDAGMCKHFYHVTCAQRLGLLIDLESEAHRHHRGGGIFGTSNNNHRQQNGKSGCGAVAVRSTETVHSEVGYLYCKKHAPKDVSVLRMKNAYAKFVESEERRMVRWNRVSLDARQERKRAVQLRDYQQRVRHHETTTAAVTTAPTQKRAKLLHANSRILNAFSEMHELLGFDGEQFAGEFSAVPAAQLPFSLTPTFSKTFVSYMEHRDLVGLPGEDVRLAQLNRELAQRQRQQKEAERKLEELRNVHGDEQRAHADQQLLFEQFRSVLIKLAPNSPLLLSAAEKLPLETNKKMPVKRRRRSSKSPDGAKSPEIMPKTTAPSHPIRQTKSIQPNNTMAKTKTDPVADGNNNAGGDAAQTVSKTATKSVVNAAALPISPLSLQCHKCKKATDAHRLVYCDTCKCHYHIGCLDPPLAKMPAKSKFSRFECSNCACPSETDGAEGEAEKGEGGTHARKEEVSNKAVARLGAAASLASLDGQNGVCHQNEPGPSASIVLPQFVPV